MANDSTSNDGATRNRRGPFTQQTFTSIFGGRSNSVAGGAPTAPFPSAIQTGSPQEQRRRMSISTLGLSGTSPSQTSPFPFGARRASVSTAGSDSLNESAIEDDDDPSRSNPTTPFARRMSFGAQALRRAQPNTNPNPGAESGFNWSEQVRSRAESSVSRNARPSFSAVSPGGTKPMPIQERNKSVDMPAPPAAMPASRTPPKPVRKQPDAFQERILKGDFYMD